MSNRKETSTVKSDVSGFDPNQTLKDCMGQAHFGNEDTKFSRQEPKIMTTIMTISVALLQRVIPEALKPGTIAIWNANGKKIFEAKKVA